MFSMGDRVRFVNTASVELDNNGGKIIGEFGKDGFYIVLLNTPLPSRPGHEAIVMTQYCLTKISNQ